MLIEFSVENFRSIKNKVSLNLIASHDKSLCDNYTEWKGSKPANVLNSAVVYGANSSGKSNIIIAMIYLRNFVMGSHMHQKGMKLNHQPFAFDNQLIDEPSRFQISFMHKEVLYDYTLAINSKRVVEESLYSYPNGRRSMIFSRDEQIFEFKKDQKEQEILSRRTLENALYLSTSMQFNYAGTTPAYEWFQNEFLTIDTTATDRLIENMVQEMNHSKKFKDALLNALKIADLGIVDLRGKVKDLPLGELHGKLPPQLIAVMTLTGGQSVKSMDLKVKHKYQDEKRKEKTAELDFMMESEGTRRLLALIGPVIDALTYGRTLVVDELDTKLHHHISAWLVGLFHDKEQNKNGAQLIFNTHDLLLLDQDIFRRDQIWFVEKDAYSGATSLYSLADFSERKDRDVMKAYLLGRYGATPYFEDGRVV